jgi:hypothetical protein
MPRPTLEKPSELLELGRTAGALFTALGRRFGIDGVFELDLRQVYRSGDELIEDRSLAALAMHYAQFLHFFGTPQVRVRSEEVVALVHALKLALDRLLAAHVHDLDDVLVELRSMHKQVADSGYLIAKYCGPQLCYLV